MSSVMVMHIKGFFVFSLLTALWDMKLPCSFSCICKKTGNLSDISFLETSSNFRGLKKC